jgi:zinc/manganese transport system permease protein
VSQALHALLAPGFFSSAPVQVALLIGGLAAVVSGVVGGFTVLRGESYAGHALADLSVTGGSGSFLLGISPLWGFLGTGLLASSFMNSIGATRPQARDLATGIVRAAGLGLAALFLYWDTTSTSATGAAVSVLFGSMFTIGSSVIPLVIAVSAISLGCVALLYRPLLLSSLSAELAAARRMPVRVLGLVFLAVIALAVSLSALTVGAILATALLVGPAATALRLTSRPGRAILAAAGIGLLATWLGIVLAYDSFTWPPSHAGWPVSFFVVALIVAGYLITGLLRGLRNRARHNLVPVQAVPEQLPTEP